MTAAVLVQPRDTMGRMLDWATMKGLSSKKSIGQHKGTKGQGKSTEAFKPKVLKVPRKEASQDKPLLTSLLSTNPDNLTWCEVRLLGWRGTLK